MAMSIPTFAAEATPAPISLASPIATLELPVGDSLPIDDQISPTETKFTLQGDSVLEGIPTFTSNNNLYVPFMDLVDLFNIGWESDSAGNINFTSNPLPEKFINNVSLAIDPMKAAAPMSAHAPASMLPDFEEGGPVADLPWSSDIPTGPAPIIYVPDPERPTTDENEVIIEGEGILMENVYIVDVRDNKGQISVVVGNPQDPENPMDQTIFHLNDKTNIKHIMNSNQQKISDNILSSFLSIHQNSCEISELLSISNYVSPRYFFSFIEQYCRIHIQKNNKRTIESDLAVSILPNNTSTCRLEEPGLNRRAFNEQTTHFTS
ncbi:MAG: hypothetical protein ATN32_03425 [Candidatus Epulonipiscium fishelsonii]|nr:MAG: hypothetical protein ATN32_03425 [Epulopiscium sp. AS2M-Bin002]